jgi:hypothetical protein
MSATSVTNGLHCPPYALYSKHRRDHLVVPGLDLGFIFSKIKGLLAEPNVLAVVNFDESLARQNRPRHYRR